MTRGFCEYLCPHVARLVDKLAVTEVRLRVGRPLVARTRGGEQVMDYRVTAEDIGQAMARMNRFSYYAFEAELAQGYITLPGGHRVGVAGQAVVEGGVVRAWRHVGAMTIRVAHAVEGCADEVLPIIYREKRFHHTMIISPPGFGKTTLLRDVVRQVSDAGLTVGLVDERGEVAGCFAGVAQNDVGLRTDVLDGVPKGLGMVMLLRSMSPQVIAVDELGGEADARAVQQVLNAGVKLLCTAHGYGLEDVPTGTRGIFERFVVLDAPGRVQGVYDKEGALC